MKSKSEFTPEQQAYIDAITPKRTWREFLNSSTWSILWWLALGALVVDKTEVYVFPVFVGNIVGFACVALVWYTIVVSLLLWCSAFMAIHTKKEVKWDALLEPNMASLMTYNLEGKGILHDSMQKTMQNLRADAVKETRKAGKYFEGNARTFKITWSRHMFFTIVETLALAAAGWFGYATTYFIFDVLMVGALYSVRCASAEWFSSLDTRMITFLCADSDEAALALITRPEVTNVVDVNPV